MCLEHSWGQQDRIARDEAEKVFSSQIDHVVFVGCILHFGFY